MTLPTSGLFSISLVLLIIGICLLRNRDWLWNLETRGSQNGGETAMRTEAWDASRKTRGLFMLVAGVVMLAVAGVTFLNDRRPLASYICSLQSDVAAAPAEPKVLVLYEDKQTMFEGQPVLGGQGTFGGQPLTWVVDLGLLRINGIAGGELQGQLANVGQDMVLFNARNEEYSCDIQSLSNS